MRDCARDRLPGGRATCGAGQWLSRWRCQSQRLRAWWFSLRHPQPQQTAQVVGPPGQAAMQANRAKRPILQTSPPPQGLGTAVQVVSGGGGVHCRARLMRQRGEFRGGRLFAGLDTVKGLHRSWLSTQQHGLGMKQTFCGARLALQAHQSGCSPHGCWVSRGRTCLSKSCPICPGGWP